ncbi:MAG: helix-turn-helix domain-containing protein [Firmicutes bacterium]|nr:helix-turn-helix domain-containing protein [Bacillota bacterium]
MEKEAGMLKAEDDRKESLGQFLKSTREGKGISLKEAAEETKIRVRYLQALEEDDFACLPGEVYARGFLRNYARFLGIPAKEISRFEPISAPAEKEIVLKQPVLERRSKRERPRRWLPALLLGLSVLVALFLLLGYFTRLAGQGGENGGPPKGAIPPVLPPHGEDIDEGGENEDWPLGELTLLADTEHMVEYLVSKGPIVLEVRAGDTPCWLRVIADGAPIADETLQPGDVREYTAEESLGGRAGNPGSLSLVVNGQEVGEIGKLGIPKDFSFVLE